ncbi:MAG: ATP-binding protein [Pirellulaceae bacterium]
MAKRIAVVVSQGQSASPAKRKLEEDIVTALLLEPGVDVTVIPHLYDLKSDGTGWLALQGISGDMIVLAWLYDRATRWTLDRHGIRGREGVSLLAQQDEGEDDEAEDDEAEADEGRAADADAAGAGDEKIRVAEQRSVPSRRIYCIDLRAKTTAQAFLDEVRRIVQEANLPLVQLGGWLGGQPTPQQLVRFTIPQNDTALPLIPSPRAEPRGEGDSLKSETFGAANALTSPWTGAAVIAEDSERRWYPVIDYSRCTNCMECIDFCLFGVYGIDRTETILVEQPDNCRKGCPACSRVCPENAIIFPQHKTPAIAGAPVGLVSLKIDLSRLFGAPDQGKSAAEIAALERDEQLMMAGRQPVGVSAGMPKRQEGKSAAPKDDLDALLDALDDADL